MPRLSASEAILFPVVERPVFAIMEISGSEQRLPVPDKRAIVNRNNGRVLSIVGRGYRLVTNQQALDWAYQCCRSAFPDTKPSEWQVQAVDAPSTAGHCFIDLVHNSTALDFSLVDAKDRPDAYGPFIRVTNSYNGLRALAFDIGFYRKVCKNGLIVRDSVIRFKFSHVRQTLGAAPEFDIQPERIAQLKLSFRSYIDVLRALPVPRSDFGPLIRVALSIRPFALPARYKGEADDQGALDDRLATLSDHYAHDLGENAYAVFNAITDFASHPPETKLIRRERQRLQGLAGSWLVDFSQRCRVQGFKLADYIAKESQNEFQPEKLIGRAAGAPAGLVPV